MRRVTRSATALLAGLAVAAGSAGSAQAQTAAGTQYDTPADVTTVARDRRIDVVTFGFAQGDVKRDVREAIRRAGLQERRLVTTPERTHAFIDGPLGRRLTTSGAEALGRVAGAQLTTASSTSRQVFAALFGTKEDFRPLTMAIIGRGVNAPERDDRLVEGMTKGFASAGVLTVYVERTDDKASELERYAAIPGVDTIGNIDTDAGKDKLVSLILGASGSPATGATGPGATRAVSVGSNNAAALGSPAKDDGGTTVTILLAVALVGAGGFAATGMVRRRRVHG